jgi:hypothetical protein
MNHVKAQREPILIRPVFDALRVDGNYCSVLQSINHRAVLARQQSVRHTHPELGTMKQPIKLPED